MKQALIICLALGSFFPGKGQPKTIELYELIRSLLPDSTSSATIVKWNETELHQNGVSWQTLSPQKTESVYSMRGNLPVSINGKTFSCDVSNNRPCPFQIYLEGNENGYSKISLDHLSSPGFNPEQQTGFLFYKPVRSKIYRKNQDTGQVKVYTYECRIPGRRKFWMMYATMMSPLGNSIYLKIYFSEKDLKEEEINRKMDPANPVKPR